MAAPDPGTRTPDPASGRKAFLGLLRFLASGPADLAEASDAASVRLVGPAGRVRAVPRLVLRAAESRGLVARDGAAVALTGSGRMALKRLLAGDGAEFAAQHRETAARTDATGGAITVNLDESPLAALSRLVRKDGSPWFPAELVAAGDRLRADFTRGQYLPGLTVRMEPAPGRGTGARAGGIADLTDAALAARLRVNAALDAVGPELSGLLLDVCCFLKGLETVERERQWPARSAKLMLRAALQMLARHYDPPRPRKEGLRGWGAEGYRPDIGADLG